MTTEIERTGAGGTEQGAVPDAGVAPGRAAVGASPPVPWQPPPTPGTDLVGRVEEQAMTLDLWLSDSLGGPGPMTTSGSPACAASRSPAPRSRCR